MNEDLRRAREILERGTFTCVLCRGPASRTCTERGIRPLVELLTDGTWIGYSAADKVIGKATAFLYVLLGVRAVYTPVISEGALEILDAHPIDVFYGQRVPAIFNRRQTGLCPMETAVRDITQPDEALRAIYETLAKL